MKIRSFFFLSLFFSPLACGNELHWIREGGEYSFQSEGEKLAFSIYLQDASWEKLSPIIQKKFRPSGKGYRFSHPTPSWEGAQGVSAARRLINGETPQNLELTELKDWLETKKLLVYTGAGISAAAGIPTMHQLNLLFPFTLYSIEEAVTSPEKIVRKVAYFDATCEKTSPTRGHWALQQILEKHPLALYTENFDHLHQKTGLSPICLASEAWREEDLKGLDGILCIGLSADQRGLLARFKEMNPEGKILSIDLKHPTYLGKEDLLLQGDIQKALPELVALLGKTEKRQCQPLDSLL